MDNPQVARVTQITELIDQQLLKNNKTNPDLKAGLKKAKVVDQKKQTKLDKICRKAQEKSQINDIRRLVMRNKQIDTFKDIFSNSVSLFNSDPVVSEAPTPPSVSTMQTINLLLGKIKRQSKYLLLIGKPLISGGRKLQPLKSRKLQMVQKI